MTGDNNAAIRVYQAFLARRPDFYQAQFNLGCALMALRRPREAAQHFEKVLTLKPDYRAAHLHLATCYEELGDAPAAARHRAAYQGAKQPSK
jgi:tetratricopeptide (TPR) repeat protein